MSLDEPPTLLQTTTQTSQPNDLPSFGWTAYAEQTNGRFAMIGFMSLLLLEFITGQDFLTWIGWR
ncbi:MAG: hypothetical protein KME11_10275 [Timaviella obliquedivisa GSE-PSE-MK23-08B]|nr:hypothetical protein [Timaviella obliquedivisa GSE-PSE-MK23-08B]